MARFKFTHKGVSAPQFGTRSKTLLHSDVPRLSSANSIGDDGVNQPPLRTPRAHKDHTPAERLIGKAGIGLGRGKTAKRHRKVMRDSIQGVTKGDIRRMARRGGVKRISAGIYEEVRTTLRNRLQVILRDLCMVLDHMKRRTITVTDVVFVLNRLGHPLYGFDDAVR